VEGVTGRVPPLVPKSLDPIVTPSGPLTERTNVEHVELPTVTFDARDFQSFTPQAGGAPISARPRRRPKSGSFVETRKT
jgi:hypothetical protein